ncbi:class I SAM-dependent methyltransferase [Solirubrobacter sp. CPCC 204708]|uniref:Cephalosporin hydroxylase family protein n=1 Tax=Solirubrobacter deserti TaxID=2282478 RepID=A0ABT4RN73_9ACTN|nr:CmcI family methyltransferase [Solirubrobacter deserti]MBE2317424.1 class I SAM-dependent methyltransferase [Solirubrobacter deserti]MDA0140006.1 cephalosporin hydroxylase family protein [Solirubrobacter deserti]
MSGKLPPQVAVDLEAGELRDYWVRRAQQHTQDSYAGVNLSKFPEDLRVYEHLLWLAAPEVVVELGVQFGASSLWFRDRLATLTAYGRVQAPEVIGVELDTSLALPALEQADPGWSKTITLLEGDVRDPALAAQVTHLVRGRSVLIIEDSAHVYDTTRAALELYAPLVRPGGYMVVEDGCVDVEALRLEGWPRGVLPALRDWLATPAGSEFEVRRDLELYGVTCHPEGFLQRRS